MPPIRQKTALFLDIDGTLLDIARSPQAVVVPRELVCALDILRGQLKGALAFVSGRSLTDIDGLFGAFRPAAIGAHGAELRASDGTVTREPPIPAPVRDIFEALAGRIPGLLLEDKGAALALHFRLAPEAGTVLLAAMEKHRKLFAAQGVSVIHGKSVIEAKPARVDKGSAVTILAKQTPFAGRDLVFGGDDTTDIDVFRVLPQLGGHGFSVGRKLPGAAYVFKSPRAVRQWLIGLASEGLAK